MANTWEVGALYNPKWNNVDWSQPGGPGTPVYPQQQVGGGYLSTEPFNERSGIMSAGCGHSQNEPTLQQEYDEDTDSIVILVMCSLCSYIQYSLAPEIALSTVYQPQVII